MQPPHLPVLYQQIILALRPKSPGRYIDATVGAGGHARGILEKSSPDGCLLGFDLDPQALEIASQRLSDYSGRFSLIHASYTTLLDQLQAAGWESSHGIVIKAFGYVCTILQRFAETDRNGHPAFFIDGMLELPQEHLFYLSYTSGTPGRFRRSPAISPLLTTYYHICTQYIRNQAKMQ